MELDILKSIIGEVLSVDPEEITLDTKLVDELGADSLDLYQVVMAIEEKFDIEIAEEDAENIITVGDVLNQLKNKLL